MNAQNKTALTGAVFDEVCILVAVLIKFFIINFEVLICSLKNQCKQTQFMICSI